MRSHQIIPIGKASLMSTLDESYLALATCTTGNVTTGAVNDIQAQIDGQPACTLSLNVIKSSYFFLDLTLLDTEMTFSLVDVSVAVLAASPTILLNAMEQFKKACDGIFRLALTSNAVVAIAIVDHMMAMLEEKVFAAFHRAVPLAGDIYTSYQQDKVPIVRSLFDFYSKSLVACFIVE